uniref:Uncharacterized protein n=1 Tax=Aureoumbra lagunensis TaxID=44058 RepID=A0A7S3K1L1_9STRA|mmetsp:Transcript_14089/g.18815  ORF Transcript_14089/g.18815 Transcript_14089/m.18815 type:complete len:628 (+) Transcript_14089:91-1974(+)
MSCDERPLYPFLVGMKKFEDEEEETMSALSPVPQITQSHEFIPGNMESFSSLATVVPDARWVHSPRPTLETVPLCPSRIQKEEETKMSMAAQVLSLEVFIKQISNWLAIADEMVEPGGASTIWARRMQETHRIGRCLMTINKLWKASISIDPIFFGRLLVPITLRLPHIAVLHGIKTSWLTIDGSRIDTNELNELASIFVSRENTFHKDEVTSRCSRSRSPPKERGSIYLKNNFKYGGLDDDDEEDDDYSFFFDENDYQQQSDGEKQFVPPSRTITDHSENSLFNINQSIQIPTAATVSLWAALGYLPQLECLELTKCAFLPLRTASPSHVLSEPLLLLRSLCLYKCYGITADVLGDLVALCPNLDTLELHHARPWHKTHRRLHEEFRFTQQMNDHEDDSVAAWIAGVAMAAPNLRTLRLGDGVDDAALEWTAQFTKLQCLNLMHTYALEHLPRSLALVLNTAGGPFQRQHLVALSIHIDGRDQSCDNVAQIIANSLAALSLRVLSLADHVPKASQTEFFDQPDTNNFFQTESIRADTLTDTGLLALGRGCRVLSRFMLDDARAITARGATRFLSTVNHLDQLILRRCFGPRFDGAQQLYDLAAQKRVQIFWEPCDDQIPFFPSKNN